MVLSPVIPYEKPHPPTATGTAGLAVPVVADDLSGGAEAGVAFARTGLGTVTADEGRRPSLFLAPHGIE